MNWSDLIPGDVLIGKFTPNTTVLVTRIEEKMLIVWNFDFGAYMSWTRLGGAMVQIHRTVEDAGWVLVCRERNGP